MVNLALYWFEQVTCLCWLLEVSDFSEFVPGFYSKKGIAEILTANIFCGKSGIRIVFRKAFLPLQALKSYLQPPVVPGESQSVNQVLA